MVSLQFKGAKVAASLPYCDTTGLHVTLQPPQTAAPRVPAVGMRLSVLVHLASACIAAALGGVAVRLRTEYLSNPLGIDVASPRFSWALSVRSFRSGARTYQDDSFSAACVSCSTPSAASFRRRTTS